MMSESPATGLAPRFGMVLAMSTLLAACPNSPVDSASSSGDTAIMGPSTGAPTTSAGASTTLDESTTAAGATTAAGTTGVAATTIAEICGDSVLDVGEDCDDGNQVNGDGCNTDCTKSGELRWEYRSNLADVDLFNAVAVTPDGGIVAGGASAPASLDLWLCKFTADGVLTWSKNYDKSGFDELKALSVHETMIYAAGGIKPDKFGDAWIAGLDLDGVILWEDELDSPFGEAFATGLATSPEGDVFVAGLVTVEGGNAEIWTRRYSPAGVLQWQENAAINDKATFALGPPLSVNADTVAVGFTTKPGPTELLLTYATGGGEPLLKLAPSMSMVGISGILLAPGGDILLASYGTVDGQMLVRRLDGRGGLLWASPECVGNLGKALAVDSQGDVVVVGSGVGGGGGNNIRLCKFSADGALRWGRDIDGGEGDDLGFAVAILPDDSIAAAGRMSSGVELLDAWLAVYSP